MPRKIRQLKADLLKAGFTWRPGKGRHTKWEHPLLPGEILVLSGNDGDDAQCDAHDDRTEGGAESARHILNIP